MPIDTRDKRASAVHVSLPWRGMLPAPDGAINQGDRQHAAFMYRGILAAGSISITGEDVFVSPGRRRTTALDGRRTTFVSGGRRRIFIKADD